MWHSPAYCPMICAPCDRGLVNIWMKLSLQAGNVSATGVSRAPAMMVFALLWYSYAAHGGDARPHQAAWCPHS